MIDEDTDQDDISSRLRRIERRNGRRGAALWVIVGILIAAPFTANAVIPSEPPFAFESGTTIEASHFNDLFDELYAEAHDPCYENPETGEVYSLKASPCGASVSVTGDFGGYSGGKTFCEDACEDEPTAHMCTVEEVVRFVSTGGDVSSFVMEVAWVNAAASTIQVNDNHQTDCFGWTNNNGMFAGSLWQLTNYVDQSSCGGSHPILCCD